VTREMFEAAGEVAIQRQWSRTGGQNPHRATRQFYRLRSYVFCAACHRRMFGTSKKGIHYYSSNRSSLTHTVYGLPGNRSATRPRWFSDGWHAGRGAFLATELGSMVLARRRSTWRSFAPCAEASTT
jgi:hypothetical protein